MSDFLSGRVSVHLWSCHLRLLQSEPSWLVSQHAYRDLESSLYEHCRGSLASRYVHLPSAEQLLPEKACFPMERLSGRPWRDLHQYWIGNHLVIPVHFRCPKLSDAGGCLPGITRGWRLRIDVEACLVFEDLISEYTLSRILFHGAFEQMGRNLFT